jgi:hypothetical protein
MNPHNATERPGAHLVAEEFGVEDPWALSDDHPLRDPLDLVGRMVAEAARDVDELHGELTRAAQSAIALLEPIARGEHASMRDWDGVLRTTRPQIELLVARRSAAYEQLTRSISTHRRLQSGPDASQPSTTSTPSLAKGQGSGRHDDWAISGGLQHRALEAAEAGELRFHQSAVYGYTYVSDAARSPSDPNPGVWPETVQRLVADGLLDQDTSEALYRPGQLLSLTPQGEIALRDARTASPRVSAALSRSSASVTVGTAAEPAAVAATGALAKPSRSR